MGSWEQVVIDFGVILVGNWGLNGELAGVLSSQIPRYYCNWRSDFSLVLASSYVVPVYLSRSDSHRESTAGSSPKWPLMCRVEGTF